MKRQMGRGGGGLRWGRVGRAVAFCLKGPRSLRNLRISCTQQRGFETQRSPYALQEEWHGTQRGATRRQSVGRGFERPLIGRQCRRCGGLGRWQASGVQQHPLYKPRAPAEHTVRENRAIGAIQEGGEATVRDSVAEELAKFCKTSQVQRIQMTLASRLSLQRAGYVVW